MSQSYIFVDRLQKLDIHTAKVNAITGSSYVELPDWVKNKKAIINIQNKDQKCFLYSVLCALKTPSSHPERPSHYANRVHELLYKEDDMPMNIGKVMFFEKRNNLRINIYSIENDDQRSEQSSNSIFPLFVSCNKEKIELPLIHLMFHENHYSYIKDFDRLMGSHDVKHYVCPYCCEFQSNGNGSKEAMDKHMSYCITGQKVQIRASY